MAKTPLLDRVLLFGSAFTDELKCANLQDDINLEEYETVIWQPATWWVGLPDMSVRAIGQIIGSIEGRLKVLTHWVMAGNDLVVVLDRLSPFVYAPPISPQDAEIFDFRRVPPLSAVDFDDVTGERLRFAGPTSLSGFFDPWLDRLCYQEIISGDHLAPLFTVSAANNRSTQIVGGIVPYGKGKLILVPPDNFDPRSKARSNYLLGLARMPALLRQGTGELPSWLGNFRTLQTSKAQQAIEQLSHQIAAARAQIAALEEEVSKDAWTQLLYAGTGESFENAVMRALSELGFTVVSGPNSRADLVLTDGTRLAAAEAKGLEGSVKELNLRQTERWVTEVNHALVSTEVERRNDIDLHRYHECLCQIGVALRDDADFECKGLMIVGTFRKTPLDERGTDYPDQLARPLGRSRICSVTGLQLFNILMESRDKPELKTTFVDMLFETNGPLQGWNDWALFLSNS
ncbi:hypothetical protein [Bradyrhizobium japonicum]|uniref:hypothetical protein n=1 Tax=Bradyrhizobium japonicum TaxID=375 RepID=UPI003398BD59